MILCLVIRFPGHALHPTLAENSKVNMPLKNKRDEIAVTQPASKTFAPYSIYRTMHLNIMKKWANSCPPLGMGGAASPLVSRSAADRVRFVRRLEEEGARVFAHVTASVGTLEVTALEVR